MSRELNPEFFPEARRSALPSQESKNKIESPPVAAEDFRLLASQVEMLKRRYKESEARLETTNTRLNDLINGSKVRFERLLGNLQRMDEMAKTAIQDLNQKQSQLASRINERRVGDAKIQELVDRHNQLVQSFEVRITQMQKVMAEQEMQLMTSRSELKEAQRELARMKRL